MFLPHVFLVVSSGCWTPQPPISWQIVADSQSWFSFFPAFSSHAWAGHGKCHCAARFSPSGNWQLLCLPTTIPRFSPLRCSFRVLFPPSSLPDEDPGKKMLHEQFHETTLSLSTPSTLRSRNGIAKSALFLATPMLCGGFHLNNERTCGDKPCFGRGAMWPPGSQRYRKSNEIKTVEDLQFLAKIRFDLFTSPEHNHETALVWSSLTPWFPFLKSMFALFALCFSWQFGFHVAVHVLQISGLLWPHVVTSLKPIAGKF